MWEVPYKLIVASFSYTKTFINYLKYDISYLFVHNEVLSIHNYTFYLDLDNNLCPYKYLGWILSFHLDGVCLLLYLGFFNSLVLFVQFKICFSELL